MQEEQNPNSINPKRSETDLRNLGLHTRTRKQDMSFLVHLTSRVAKNRRRRFCSMGVEPSRSPSPEMEDMMPPGQERQRDKNGREEREENLLTSISQPKRIRKARSKPIFAAARGSLISPIPIRIKNHAEVWDLCLVAGDVNAEKDEDPKDGWEDLDGKENLDVYHSCRSSVSSKSIYDNDEDEEDCGWDEEDCGWDGAKGEEQILYEAREISVTKVLVVSPEGGGRGVGVGVSILDGEKGVVCVGPFQVEDWIAWERQKRERLGHRRMSFL